LERYLHPRGPPLLPVSLFQRAVPTTPADQTGAPSISSLSVQPSPVFGRVGICIMYFEACSGFTRVTARRIAQPLAGLRHEASIPPIARQNRSSATRPIDNCQGGASLH